MLNQTREATAEVLNSQCRTLNLHAGLPSAFDAAMGTKTLASEVHIHQAVRCKGLSLNKFLNQLMTIVSLLDLSEQNGWQQGGDVGE